MRYFLAPLMLVCLTANFAKASSYATFVSNTGVDSGACTEAAPCRTFAFALSQTHTGGVISVIASGTFGPLRITRSVSIVADGVTALIQSRAICSSGVTAAVCISGAGRVVLHGLTIDMPPQSEATQVGIRFDSGQSFEVDKCLIRNPGAAGIDFEPSSSSALSVSDTTVSDSSDGIKFLPQATGNYTATFDHVSAENNGIGLLFSSATGDSAQNGVVTNSVFSGNGSLGTGIDVEKFTNLTIDRTTVSTNVVGIADLGSNAIVRIGDSAIVGNGTGLSTSFSGQILSFGTNKLTANGTDGSFTGTVAPQ